MGNFCGKVSAHSIDSSQIFIVMRYYNCRCTLATIKRSFVYEKIGSLSSRDIRLVKPSHLRLLTRFCFAFVHLVSSCLAVPCTLTALLLSKACFISYNFFLSIFASFATVFHFTNTAYLISSIFTLRKIFSYFVCIDRRFLINFA